MTDLQKAERTLRILECAYESPNLKSADRKYVKAEVKKLTETILNLRQPKTTKSEPKTAEILAENLQQNLNETGSDSVGNYNQNWNQNGDRF